MATAITSTTTVSHGSIFDTACNYSIDRKHSKNKWLSKRVAKRCQNRQRKKNKKQKRTKSNFYRIGGGYHKPSLKNQHSKKRVTNEQFINNCIEDEKDEFQDELEELTSLIDESLMILVSPKRRRRKTKKSKTPSPNSEIGSENNMDIDLNSEISSEISENEIEKEKEKENEIKKEISDVEFKCDDPTKLDEIYCAEISKIVEYNEYSSIIGLSDRSIYKSNKNDSTAMTSTYASNFKKICKEIKTNLPQNIHVSWNGSMFVRFDEDNPRFLQALLIGLLDTPYQNGCFLFDIYLPNEYPTQPPKITHSTKGGNMVKANNGPGGFSPNLHKSTGKVCLSLLGTWSTSIAGAGWDPKRGNVYQVLSTILLMIFGARYPYYMEPGHGGWEGNCLSSENDKDHPPRVIEYKEEVIWGTLKYGILQILQEPYIGFEDVIKTHFRLKRKEILYCIEQWIENGSENLKNRIEPISKEIKIELEKL